MTRIVRTYMVSVLSMATAILPNQSGPPFNTPRIRPINKKIKCITVLVLPILLVFKVVFLNLAKTLIKVIKISLKTIRLMAHQGNISLSIKIREKKALKVSSLSAKGSRNIPISDCNLYLLAI